jgi:hypothetical protein
MTYSYPGGTNPNLLATTYGQDTFLRVGNNGTLVYT